MHQAARSDAQMHVTSHRGGQVPQQGGCTLGRRALFAGLSGDLAMYNSMTGSIVRLREDGRFADVLMDGSMLVTEDDEADYPGERFLLVPCVPIENLIPVCVQSAMPQECDFVKASHEEPASMPSFAQTTGASIAPCPLGCGAEVSLNELREHLLCSCPLNISRLQSPQNLDEFTMQCPSQSQAKMPEQEVTGSSGNVLDILLSTRAMSPSEDNPQQKADRYDEQLDACSRGPGDAHLSCKIYIYKEGGQLEKLDTKKFFADAEDSDSTTCSSRPTSAKDSPHRKIDGKHLENGSEPSLALKESARTGRADEASSELPKDRCAAAKATVRTLNKTLECPSIPNKKKSRQLAAASFSPINYQTSTLSASSRCPTERLEKIVPCETLVHPPTSKEKKSGGERQVSQRTAQIRPCVPETETRNRVHATPLAATEKAAFANPVQPRPVSAVSSTQTPSPPARGKKNKSASSKAACAVKDVQNECEVRKKTKRVPRIVPATSSLIASVSVQLLLILVLLTFGFFWQAELCAVVVVVGKWCQSATLRLRPAAWRRQTAGSQRVLLPFVWGLSDDAKITSRPRPCLDIGTGPLRIGIVGDFSSAQALDWVERLARQLSEEDPPSCSDVPLCTATDTISRCTQSLNLLSAKLGAAMRQAEPSGEKLTEEQASNEERVVSSARTWHPSASIRAQQSSDYTKRMEAGLSKFRKDFIASGCERWSELEAQYTEPGALSTDQRRRLATASSAESFERVRRALTFERHMNADSLCGFYGLLLTSGSDGGVVHFKFQSGASYAFLPDITPGCLPNLGAIKRQLETTIGEPLIDVSFVMQNRGDLMVLPANTHLLVQTFELASSWALVTPDVVYKMQTYRYHPRRMDLIDPDGVALLNMMTEPALGGPVCPHIRFPRDSSVNQRFHIELGEAWPCE